MAKVMKKSPVRKAQDGDSVKLKKPSGAKSGIDRVDSTIKANAAEMQKIINKRNIDKMVTVPKKKMGGKMSKKK